MTDGKQEHGSAVAGEDAADQTGKATAQEGGQSKDREQALAKETDEERESRIQEMIEADIADGGLSLRVALVDYAEDNPELGELLERAYVYIGSARIMERSLAGSGNVSEIDSVD